jgi:UDP-N-acetylmuramoylalanine-D-glutamate ligase
MKVGVDFSYKTTLPGKIAMLSCAAPSFSLWKGYIQKAQEFISAVKKY